MPDVPTYTLTCRSEDHAHRLRDALHSRGYIHATIDGPRFTVAWGGLFPFIAEIGDMARRLDYATDEEVAKFYVTWSDLTDRRTPTRNAHAAAAQAPERQRDRADRIGQSLIGAVKLLEYAMHLRKHGENAPGGTETWAQFERDCETYLRKLARGES
jgi:hypothetical protein